VIYAGVTPGILRPYPIALIDLSCWRSSVWGAWKEVKGFENETSETKLRYGTTALNHRQRTGLSHTMVGNLHESEYGRITWPLASQVLDLAAGGFVPVPFGSDPMPSSRRVGRCRRPLPVDCRTVLQQSTARQSTGTTKETGEHRLRSLQQAMAVVLTVWWPSKVSGSGKGDVPAPPPVASTLASGRRPRPSSLGDNFDERGKRCSHCAGRWHTSASIAASRLQTADTPCAIGGRSPETIDGCVNAPILSTAVSDVNHFGKRRRLIPSTAVGSMDILQRRRRRIGTILKGGRWSYGTAQCCLLCPHIRRC
jgi:hypothetical protein